MILKDSIEVKPTFNGVAISKIYKDGGLISLGASVAQALIDYLDWEATIALKDAKSWLVANTGSLIAIFTVLNAFVLDVAILYMAFKGMELSPILTLIAGANNVKAGQVLSFYFGSSKESADSKR